MEQNEIIENIVKSLTNYLSQEQCEIIRECLVTKNMDLIEKIQRTDTTPAIAPVVANKYDDVDIIKKIIFKLYDREAYFLRMAMTNASGVQIISPHYIKTMKFVSDVEYLDMISEQFLTSKYSVYVDWNIDYLYEFSQDGLLEEAYKQTKSLLSKAFVSIVSLNSNCKLNVTISVEEAEQNIKNLINSVNKDLVTLIDNYDVTTEIPQNILDEYWSIFPNINSMKYNQVIYYLLNKNDFFDKILLIHISNKKVKTQFQRYKSFNISENISQELLQFFKKHKVHFKNLFYAFATFNEFIELLKVECKDDFISIDEMKEDLFATNLFIGHEDFVLGKTNEMNYCPVSEGAQIEFFRQIFTVYKSVYKTDELYNKMFTLCTLKFANEIAIKDFYHSHYDTIDNRNEHDYRKQWTVREDLKKLFEYNIAPQYIYTILKAAFKEEDKTKKQWIKESIVNDRLSFDMTYYEELFKLDKFIQYLPEVFNNIESLANRQICLLIMASNPMLVKDFFVQIIDASATGLNICKVAYSKNPQLADELLPLINDKKAANKKFSRAILELFPKYKDALEGVTLVETAKKEKKDKEIGLVGIIAKMSKSSKKVDALFKDWSLYKHPILKDKNGVELNESYFRAIYMGYAKDCSTDSDATTKLLEELTQEAINEIGKFLLIAIRYNCDAKSKWIPYFVANHTTNLENEFEFCITRLEENTRSTIPVEAVTAFSRIKTMDCVASMDRLLRKVSHKRALAELKAKFNVAANERNLSKEQLRDLLVPSLNLNEEIILDYGSRKFNVNLQQNGTLKITDEADKEIKNLPVVGKNDDEVLADAAKENLKDLKDSLKEVVKVQSQRLVSAMVYDRRWSFVEWNELFINNPIMVQFAISLVWGIYENDKLVNTFRFMEDGTFNDINENVIELTNKTIGLIHPIELNEESLNTWIKHFEDYEVQQSFMQLYRKIYKPVGEELTSNISERSRVKSINIYTLDKILESVKWKRGEVEDHGFFSKYVKLDGDDNVVAYIDFGGMSMVYNDDKFQEVYDIVFKNVSNCTEVTPKLFSEVIDEITIAVASGTK